MGTHRYPLGPATALDQRHHPRPSGWPGAIRRGHHHRARHILAAHPAFGAVLEAAQFAPVEREMGNLDQGFVRRRLGRGHFGQGYFRR